VLEPLLGIAAVALIGALVWRRQHLASIQSELDARLPRSDTGVIVGAEPIELARASAPAMLLLHGSGDTPQSLQYLAEGLYARGYAVLAPLLPGHGRSIGEFGGVTAEEWLNAARDAFRALRGSHAWVGVAGLSMGGALAVQIAADTGDLPAIALLAPYLSMPPKDALAAWLSPLWRWWIPVARTASDGSILDPIERARNLAYGVFVPPALRALWTTQRRAAAALPLVRAPCLVIQSRQDNRISMRSCERSFARLGASEKRLEWIDGAGHVITVDYGRARVVQMVGDWMDAHRQA
jgi:carboxylesterase